MFEIAILRLTDLEQRLGGAPPWLEQGLTAVFKGAALRWPDTAEAQQHFTNLWLGDYLHHDRDWAYVAIDGPVTATEGRVAGYLVGSLAREETDPRFESLGYLKDFAPHFPLYPAHLHMNLDAAYRSRGIGKRLIAALVADLRSAQIPGVHIVTARTQRNVRFYSAAGFAIVAATQWNGRDLVMMGLDL